MVYTRHLTLYHARSPISFAFWPIYAMHAAIRYFAKSSVSDAHSPFPLRSYSQCQLTVIARNFNQMYINKNSNVKHFVHMHSDTAEFSIQLKEIETTTPPTAASQ